VAFFGISCYDEKGKDFFKNPDFVIQVPALLIEIISREELQESQ